MAEPITDAEVEVLLRRAGLVLAPAQRAEVRAAWRAVQDMLARNRAPAPDADEVAAASAEPAVTFAAESRP